MDLLIINFMKKFLISTPGRTASSSFFNYVEQSLLDTGATVAAVDRGQYANEEWTAFNTSEYAAFTTFNPFGFVNAVNKINPSEWCLILLTRKDIAAWLLSINALHVTNEWHPGKDYQAKNLTFSKDAFMSSYWYYQCWQRMVYNQADSFGFGQVVRVDFDNLVKDWPAVGQQFGWTWAVEEKRMKMGQTATWDSVTNLEQVLTWIPEEYIIQQIINSL